MALVLKDRVKETSTTTGTGDMILAGAATGFQSFSVIGNGNTTYYTIAGGSQWEVGIGTYESTGPNIKRDTVLSNSLGTTAKIDFAAGSKDVFVTYPSERSVYTIGAGVTSDTGAAYINKTTTTANVTINSGENGMSVGALTVGSGYTTSIASGQRWLIL